MALQEHKRPKGYSRLQLQPVNVMPDRVWCLSAPPFHNKLGQSIHQSFLDPHWPDWALQTQFKVGMLPRYSLLSVLYKMYNHAIRERVIQSLSWQKK